MDYKKIVHFSFFNFVHARQARIQVGREGGGGGAWVHTKIVKKIKFVKVLGKTQKLF